jgi:lipase
MQLRQLDVPVDGGDLRVLLWGTGRRVAVAVHGITGSGMSWQAVARQMPPSWTLAAPDMRGRGHSSHLPGPYGLERHVADVAAVLRHFGGRPVLAGHSMGGFVALLSYDAHPRLARRLVLVGASHVRCCATRSGQPISQSMIRFMSSSLPTRSSPGR